MSPSRSFTAPSPYQRKVLTIGILLARVLRAIFVALGAAPLAALSFMLLVIGLRIVFAANAFALLGLRALFSLVSGPLDRLV